MSCTKALPSPHAGTILRVSRSLNLRHQGCPTLIVSPGTHHTTHFGCYDPSLLHPTRFSNEGLKASGYSRDLKRPTSCGGLRQEGSPSSQVTMLKWFYVSQKFSRLKRPQWLNLLKGSFTSSKSKGSYFPRPRGSGSKMSTKTSFHNSDQRLQ